MNQRKYEFDFPQQENFIKVIGVGGGGGNAARSMFHLGITGVDFVVCNTDVQALESSPIPKKISLGKNLTSGLGAGANPEVGKNAAIESKDEIKELLSDGTKMVFITAGMGGGTGTGAAPEIAEIAQKLGILTVAIVTLPFSFEGKKKLIQAQEGIKNLRQHCDTVLVILNDRIKDLFSDLTLGTAFQKADLVQTTAAKSIAEIITVPGYVNVDFEDVKTVMKKAGTAVMGSGEANGENRAFNAVKDALSSPLLEYKNIRGAKKILLSIVFGESKESELGMDELSVITDYIREKIGDDAEMIFGYGAQTGLGDKLRVTIIATGFSDTENLTDEKMATPDCVENIEKCQPSISADNIEPLAIKEKINHKNKENSAFKKTYEDIIFSEEILEIPTYKRNGLRLDLTLSENSEKVLIVS